MPCFSAGVGNFLGHIPLERAVHDVVVGLLGIPEAEPVVVFGQKDDVRAAGILDDLDPFAGVELVRIPFLVEVVVLLDRASALPRDQPISCRSGVTGPQQMNMPKRMSFHASTASGWGWSGSSAAAQRLPASRQAMR